MNTPSSSVQVEKAVEERARDVARWAARKKEDNDDDDDSVDTVKKPRKVMTDCLRIFKVTKKRVGGGGDGGEGQGKKNSKFN